jgi:hypothetical protein
MATKNSFPKKECDICHAMISVIGMTAHKKTEKCKSSQKSGIPYAPTQEPEVLKIYSAYNKSKREREIEAIGLEEVQKRDREKKQAQRAKKKEEQVIVEPTPPSKILQPKRNQNKIPKNLVIEPPVVEEVEPRKFEDKKEFLKEFLKVTNAKRAPSKWMKETTADVYVTDFTKFANNYTNSEVDYSNLAWLNNVDKVMEYLNSKWRRPNGSFYAPATKKNMLLAFGSVASMLGMKKASTVYNDFAIQINDSLKKTT